MDCTLSASESCQHATHSGDSVAEQTVGRPKYSSADLQILSGPALIESRVGSVYTKIYNHVDSNSHVMP